MTTWTDAETGMPATWTTPTESGTWIDQAESVPGWSNASEAGASWLDIEASYVAEGYIEPDYIFAGPFGTVWTNAEL